VIPIAISVKNNRDMIYFPYRSAPFVTSLIGATMCVKLCPSPRNLSDIDQDGKLTAEEFILAMHLIDMAMSGLPLPPVLPPDYLPPTFRWHTPPRPDVPLYGWSVVIKLVVPKAPHRPGQHLKAHLYPYLHKVASVKCYCSYHFVNFYFYLLMPNITWQSTLILIKYLLN